MAATTSRPALTQSGRSNVVSTFSPRTPQAIACWLMLANLATYLITFLTLGSMAISGLFLLASVVLAVVTLILRIVLVKHSRPTWIMLAVATTLGLASILQLAAMGEGTTRSFPGLPELSRIVFIILGYIALMLHLRMHASRWYASVWVDGLAAALATAALGARFIESRPGLDSGRPDMEVAALVMYPVSDVFLFALLGVTSAVLGAKLDASLKFIAVAVAILVVADITTLVQTLESGAPLQGTLSETGSLITVCLITCPAGLVVTSQSEHRMSSPAATRRQHLSTMIVPTVAGLLAMVMLIPFEWLPTSPAAQLLALSALACVGVRSLLAHREIWELFGARLESRTDELTGLLNRRGFYEYTTRALSEQHGPSDHPGGAVLILDLDEFKEINDSLGHHAGDQLLGKLADRLVDGIDMPGVTLARLGGDEMALYLSDGFRAEELAELIATLMLDPFDMGGVNVQVSASIGIAIAPMAGTTLHELLRCADIAMYQAKRSRSTYVIYDAVHPDMDREDRLTRLAELRTAIDLDHRQLVLHYQPKVDLTTGLAVGVEALIRWQHPERGLIFPDQFLPLVESAGLMPRLTDVVLERAVEQVAQWRAEGVQLSVAVNVPSAAIVDQGLPDRVARLLADHNLSPRDLTLEITEETLLEDRVRARLVMASMRSLGVSISIDDYGTGYSSLAYLRELPVDELKLDRSFITPMTDDARAAAIVRSTIDLAHSLGLSIVAEGVEDGDAATRLQAYGCDSVQGYHYSRPLPPERVMEWFAEHSFVVAGVDLGARPAENVG